MAIRTGTFEPGHTAQVFIFPLRDRVASLATREQKFAAMEAMAQSNPVASASDSWYHDDALSETTDKTN
jgi:hypothetical protein